MKKEQWSITLKLNENRVYIHNKGDKLSKCKIEIYSDNELMMERDNTFIPKGLGQWYNPGKSLLKNDSEIKAVVTLTEAIVDEDIKKPDIDPYGEEDWEDNSFILEKKWKVNYEVKEI